jgi:toxin YoeB
VRAILFVPDARAAYLSWQQHDRKTLERINTLTNDAAREPFAWIGKPEPLRGNLAGDWSRRIDDTHRMVYRATHTELVMLACRVRSDG